MFRITGLGRLRTAFLYAAMWYGLIFVLLGLGVMASGDVVAGLLCIVFIGGLNLGASWFLVRPGIWREELTRRLERAGVRGTATVETMQRTPVSVGSLPVYAFDLNLRLPGQPVTTVEHREKVPWEWFGAVGVGTVLPVLAEPGDPSKWVIDWGRAPDRSQEQREDPDERLRELDRLHSAQLIDRAEYERERARILGSI